LTRSTVDESEVSPHDALGRVLGSRVRGMGLGVVPSNTFKNLRLHSSNFISSSSSSISCPSSNQWQAKYNNLELTFKAYMIMKEGSIPEELAGFFTSEIVSINDQKMIKNVIYYLEKCISRFFELFTLVSRFLVANKKVYYC